MSHHSSEESLALLGVQSPEKREKILEALKNEQLSSVLGPTKEFPHGKIVPHDEGGLIFGVTVVHGRVVFDFGKPIRSIGFTREGALELAELLRLRAESCPPIIQRKEPFAINARDLPEVRNKI